MSNDYTPQDTMFLWGLADPAAPRLVGEINLVKSPRGVSMSYAPDWLRHGFSLSEDLPLVDQVFMPDDKDRAAGAVDDARPDRWGERVIRALDRPVRLSLLEYLYFAGGDRFGALVVSLHPDRCELHAAAALPDLGDVRRIHQLVQDVAHGAPVAEHERRLLQPGRTLGGARPKSIVLIDDAQWVLKFADEYDLDWPLLEHATMSLARDCGLDVAETRAIPLGSGRSAVAVKRFDRIAPAARGDPERRIHAISLDVALRAAGEEFGYPEMASVLRRIGPVHSQAQDMRELFGRMVFNILLDNTDDHEKNHCLLRGDDGGYRLSPAFDVVPSLLGLGAQQIRVGSAGHDATLDNALSHAIQFGLSVDDAVDDIRRIAEVAAGWKDAFRLAGVRDRDIQAAEPSLDGKKVRMRDEFLRTTVSSERRHRHR